MNKVTYYQILYQMHKNEWFDKQIDIYEIEPNQYYFIDRDPNVLRGFIKTHNQTKQFIYIQRIFLYEKDDTTFVSSLGKKRRKAKFNFKNIVKLKYAPINNLVEEFENNKILGKIL